MLPIREREEVCTSGVREGCTGAPYKRERGGVHRRGEGGVPRCAPVPRARTASRRPSHSGVPPSRRRQSRHRVRAGPACATHTPRPALALSLLSRCAVRHRAPPPLGVRGER